MSDRLGVKMFSVFIITHVHIFIFITSQLKMFSLEPYRKFFSFRSHTDPFRKIRTLYKEHIRNPYKHFTIH